MNGKEDGTNIHSNTGTIGRLAAGLVSATLFFWAFQIAWEVPVGTPQRVTISPDQLSSN